MFGQIFEIYSISGMSSTLTVRGKDSLIVGIALYRLKEKSEEVKQCLRLSLIVSKYVTK